MIKGSILSENNKTLKELKIESKKTFFISKQSFPLEEEFKIKAPEQAEINQKINRLKQIFSDFSDELFALALEKHNYDEEETALTLMDDGTLMDYREDLAKIQIERNKNSNKTLFNQQGKINNIFLPILRFLFHLLLFLLLLLSSFLSSYLNLL